MKNNTEIPMKVKVTGAVLVVGLAQLRLASTTR